jgi:hypothetical protein
VWLIMAVIKGVGKEDSPLKFAVAVLLSGVIASGIGGAIFATTEFRSGPEAPEKDVMAKPGK